VLFRLALALAILTLVACVAGHQAGVGCTMFHGEDKPGPAVANAPAEPVDLMAGQWEGTWSNTSDSMSGRLTCSITPLGGDKYKAEFHAVFLKVMTYDTTVTLTVQREAGMWKFHGEKDLGLLAGGVFTYDGHTDGYEFYSAYDSRSNKGVYRMTRHGATSQPSSGPASEN
jgi:hypothetical protein